MLPITLGVAGWPVMLVGAGPALQKRLRLLREADVAALSVYCEDAPTTSAEQVRRWPVAREIAGARVLFIAGLPMAQAARIVAVARRHRVLVNVEDAPALCDFHVPALVRRGDLSIAVSTAGKSPGLAALLRRALATQFDASWGMRLAELAAARMSLRQAGADGAEVIRGTEQLAAPWLRAITPRP